MEAPRKNRQDWGVGRAAFFACAAAICAEIEQGWPVAVVHRKFRDRVKLSYQQFNRHVKAHLNKKDAAASGEAGATAPMRATPPSAPRRPSAGETPDGPYRQRQFHYDPMVDKDDLV